MVSIWCMFLFLFVCSRFFFWWWRWIDIFGCVRVIWLMIFVILLSFVCMVFIYFNLVGVLKNRLVMMIFVFFLLEVFCLEIIFLFWRMRWVFVFLLMFVLIFRWEIDVIFGKVFLWKLSVFIWNRLFLFLILLVVWWWKVCL